MPLRVLVVLVLLVAPASADEPDRRRFYFGAQAGALFVPESGGWYEASVDGGWKTPWKRIWVRGKVVQGGADVGDRTGERWRGGLAGVEVRSLGRHGRAVAGLDVGAVEVDELSEGILQ